MGMEAMTNNRQRGCSASSTRSDGSGVSSCKLGRELPKSSGSAAMQPLLSESSRAYRGRGALGTGLFNDDVLAFPYVSMFSTVEL
eukprot:scaffold779_cov165-Amphora_coffeaeformis.AAC.11